MTRQRAQYPLHHGQVLQIVVRLEHGNAHVKLKYNRPNTPHIARLTPAHFQYYFRGTK